MNWDTDTACGNKHSPDFFAIAKAYGLEAFYADTDTTFADELDKFIECSRGALFHIRIDARHDISPMLMGGQTLDKMWPYYNLDGSKND
jgi:acetolactate synthase-1/2/3 large subunit